MNTDILIIGAGIAGLACARRLADAGHHPVVLDKGRGIGGRMATRRIDVAGQPIRFDHGAQYLTVRDAGFGAAMAALATHSAAWPDGTTDHSAVPRLVGVPGMSSLPRAMAAGLDVRTGSEATAIRATAGWWCVQTADGTMMATRLVLAIPAPQAANLLGAGHPLHAKLAGVAMEPCLTLMAAVPGDLSRPFIARTAKDHPIAWIAQDSSKPGRSTLLTAWVAQASAEWSALHIEETPAALAQRMVPMLAEAIGCQPDAVIHAAVHRWRYARVAQPLGVPFLANDDATLHVGGDWCLGERVEDGWRSGAAMADAVLARD